MLGSLKLKRQSSNPKEQGLTSVVVVLILVVLLSLLSIGFTRVANRSLQSSSANEQSTAANYAAQSGINDVIAYLKANPTATATHCDDLIKAGGPLANQSNISGNGNTSYTCALLDSSPDSLFYQNLPPYGSQIVKIVTSAPPATLLFSWESPNHSHNQFVPNANGQTLSDETTWGSNNYAPLLRLTLYPIPASGDLSGVQAASRTFFLYPQTGGGSNVLVYGSTTSGIQSINCPNKKLNGFSDITYDCNVEISNLPAAGSYYARFAPYYDQALVKIRANDASGQPVKFENAQSIIDVTAKSGNSTKRLQARVDTSSNGGGTDTSISALSDLAPEFAVQSANNICKRLLVPSDTGQPAVIEPGSAANCSTTLLEGNGKPSVSLFADPKSVKKDSTTKVHLAWVNKNANNCQFTAPSGGPNAPPSGTQPDNGSVDINFKAQKTTYTIQCTSTVSNTKVTASATVDVDNGGGGGGGGGSAPYCEIYDAAHDYGNCFYTYDGGHWNDYAATCSDGVAGTIHKIYAVSDDGTVSASQCLDGSNGINNDCAPNPPFQVINGSCVQTSGGCAPGYIMVNGSCVANEVCPDGYTGSVDLSKQGHYDQNGNYIPYNCQPANNTGGGGGSGGGQGGGGSCSNGADNPPQCTTSGGACLNGDVDPPDCTIPPGNTGGCGFNENALPWLDYAVWSLPFYLALHGGGC